MVRTRNATATPIDATPLADLPTTPVIPASTSKIAGVIELLQRPGGATLAELVATTGWLPHTTRAALTGLRKKGHVIEKRRRDGATAYNVLKAA